MPAGGGSGSPIVAYVVHVLGDGRARHRRRQLERLGCRVLLAGFSRRETPLPDEADILCLGRTADQAFGRRLIAMLIGAVRLWRARDFLAASHVVIARNLEQALVVLVAGWLARSRPPLVYEVLDLHPLQTGSGLFSRIVRALEQFVLRRCALLVVSSPFYVEKFYATRMGYRGPWFLLENKLPQDDVEIARRGLSAAHVERRPAPPWKIAWLGYLRCARSLEIITALAARRPDLVSVIIRGIPQGVVAAELEARIRDLPNVSFGGPYRHPDELGVILAGADLVWIVHYQWEENARLSWFNRMYDALCFHRPMLVREGTALGSFVLEHGAGWTLAEPVAENLERLLESLSEERWQATVRHIARLPRRVYVDVDDHARLLAQLFPDRFATATPPRRAIADARSS